MSTRHHWADVFTVRRQGPHGRKGSTMNSTATCSTWRGMGFVRLYFAQDFPCDDYTQTSAVRPDGGVKYATGASSKIRGRDNIIIDTWTTALPCHIHLPVCLWIMDSNSRAPKKNTSIGSEVLLQDATHLIQKPCYHWGSLCQDPAGNWTTWRPPDHCKEMQTAVVWTCLPFIRSGQNHLARHSERGKKTRQTEEEVGRQTEEWSNIESCVWLTCQKEERSSIQSCVWPTRQGENWWSTEIHTWLTCHEEHGRSVEKTGGQGHSQQREEQGFSGGRVAPREQAVKHINITSMCWWFFFLLFVFGLFACTGRF